MKRRTKKRRPRKRRSASNQSLHFGQLEDRKMFAVAGLTSTAVLDFDGEWMNQAQLSEGQWSIDNFDVSGNGVSFPSFNSLFTGSRSWLDLDGDGRVNSVDAQRAINTIVDKVVEDYSPYDLNIVVGDQDSYRNIMGDLFGGDVTVIISGGTDNTVDADGNRNSSWGWAPLDANNDRDDHAFVYAGGSVDFFTGNADQWLNQVARTVSHEMGHSFGLEHQTDDPNSWDTDSITHSIMGTADRDWTRDFSFHDKSYEIDDTTETQNAHRHLSQENILGRSDDDWMAVLKPGELTIQASEGWVTDQITVSNASGGRWRIGMNNTTTFINPVGQDTTSMNPFNDTLARINVHTGNGNDEISFDSSVTARLFAWAGSGDDLVRGGAGADYLHGGDGNDRLYGRNGNDVLVGGNGNDRLYGQGHHDRLYGGNNNDYLSGGSGNDRMYGQSGYDRLFGSSGNDQLYGGIDGTADYLHGGSGADSFDQEMYFDIWSWSNRNRETNADFDFSEGDRLI